MQRLLMALSSAQRACRAHNNMCPVVPFTSVLKATCNNPTRKVSTQAWRSRVLQLHSLSKQPQANAVTPQHAWIWRRTQYTDSRGYTHFGSGGTNRFGLGPVGAILATVTVVGFGVFYIRSIETVPYTGRRHAIMFVSQAQERTMGQQIFQQQVMEAQAAHALLPPSHPYVRVVQRVGMQVARVATDGQGGGMSDHMKNTEWEFAVIKNPVPNAFVVPGGKVVVFTGLLDILASEDELAAVLAHETAHVLARHHAERISTLNVFALMKLLAWAFLGIGLPNSAMVLGVFLPYSRLAEYEADEIGLLLMAKACYDPAAAPSMLEKLHKKEQQMESKVGISTPQFLRTHPLTDARVKKVEEELPKAYELYKSSGCGVVSSFVHQVMDPVPAWR